MTAYSPCSTSDRIHEVGSDSPFCSDYDLTGPTCRVLLLRLGFLFPSSQSHCRRRCYRGSLQQGSLRRPCTQGRTHHYSGVVRPPELAGGVDPRPSPTTTTLSAQAWPPTLRAKDAGMRRLKKSRRPTSLPFQGFLFSLYIFTVLHGSHIAFSIPP